jgi:glycosyltransferase involved in cell wall biosynthesis
LIISEPAVLTIFIRFMPKAVTVVIPSYNEEERIEQCLQAVLLQPPQFIDKVVVADNNSQDRTVTLCRNYDVQIIQGGKPATARNNGARRAESDYLLFIDADTVLSDNFIERALSLFKKNHYKVASFFIKPHPRDLFNTVLFTVYNILCYFMARFTLPTIGTAGCCILVEKATHVSVGGFDEKMIVLEEYDYIRKIKTVGKFGIIPISVLTSTRRFQRGRRLKQAIILFIYYIKWLFRGKVNQDKLGYWQHYDK